MRFKILLTLFIFSIFTIGAFANSEKSESKSYYIKNNILLRDKYKTNKKLINQFESLDIFLSKITNQEKLTSLKNKVDSSLKNQKIKGDSKDILLYIQNRLSIIMINNTSSTIITTPSINSNRYPGCDTDDITVGSYTISACNVGATKSGLGEESYGQYFQWGRNKGFSYGDNTQQSTQIAGSVGLNAITDTNNFVWSSGLTNGDWSNTDTTNNWGNTTNTSVSRQGPCAPGYHVPSQTEWAGIVSSGGWGSNGTAMQSALKLPYAGIRFWYGGSWNLGGSLGYYWSSTPNGAYGYYLSFGSSDISPSYGINRANGFSVRCFKN